MFNDNNEKGGVSFGFIGIGQGGSNIVDCFALKYQAMAINTTENDLAKLKNIQPSLRLCFSVTRGGGAGKDIQKGEEAINKNRQHIADQIKIVFKDVDYIFVTTAQGGGTGTVGAVKVLQILHNLNFKDFGLIIALPPHDEDYRGKVNACLGLEAIREAHQKCRRFKGIFCVDNEELKKIIAEEKKPYENIWELINSKIFHPINTICEFTGRSGFTSFDPEDCRKLLDYKGYITYAEDYFDVSDAETVLAAKVVDMWQKQSVFQAGDTKLAQGAALLIERPEGFDEDGSAINQFFTQIQQHLGGCHICRGVYSVAKEGTWAEKWKDKLAGKVIKKPVKIYTFLTGLPYPEEYFKEFSIKASEELKQALAKKDIVLKTSATSEFYADFLDFYASQHQEETAAEEELDLGIFTKIRKHSQENQETIFANNKPDNVINFKDNDRLDWHKLKDSHD